MPKISAQYRDERRAHILAAARHCFVRDGFHQTSMQDLVREAGMSSGAVYRYFASKDAMIVAIAEENLDQIVAIVQESVQHGADLGAALATALEFVSARHAEDGFAAIALVVWSEALRDSYGADSRRVSEDVVVCASRLSATGGDPWRRCSGTHPGRRAGALCNRPVRRTAASLLSA
jgi:AcrR family transcriptional regulator